MAIDIGRAWFWLFRAFARRHHRDGAHLPHRRAERLRIARHVGQCPGRSLWQTFQQYKGRGKFVRLAWHQHEVDEPACRIANTNDLAAKSAPERPKACVSPPVLRLNRKLMSSVCSVSLRPPSDAPAQPCHRCRQKPVLALPRQPRAP